MVTRRIATAATNSRTHRAVRLLAVSKGQPAAAIRRLAGLGQRAFGENFVQEALAKQGQMSDLKLEWHMIGPLQSNKCRQVARHFDWLQSLDRPKLIEPLSLERPSDLPALNVLIQVNIDAESSKSGCVPDEVPDLASRIVAAPGLRLRGLMVIPNPHLGADVRRGAFLRSRKLFQTLHADHPGVDTLSMGMSEDFELAIEEGATMVRIGTALFGPRMQR
ncbi:MAG: YggS family pyridoxal phosphate-dependent enzyme [Rhodanobacteraceae bacterium]